MIQDLQFILYFMLFCFQLICIKQKVICLNKIEILLLLPHKNSIHFLWGLFMIHKRKKRFFCSFVSTSFDVVG